jgi:hypothetical protein
MSKSFTRLLLGGVLIGLLASLVAQSSAWTLMAFNAVATALVVREWNVKRRLERTGMDRQRPSTGPMTDGPARPFRAGLVGNSSCTIGCANPAVVP